MVYTFRLDDAVATMFSEPHTDGHTLEIDCRTPEGEDCRLRLELTTEGFARFVEIMAKLVDSHQQALAEDELPPAAEPTTSRANEAGHRRIERYFIAHMRESELRRLTKELRPFDAKAARVDHFEGHDRVVLWKVPDPRVQTDDNSGYRVYLSPGALRAAAQARIPVEVAGEISRRELPDDRHLLIGDAPLDWQETTMPSATLRLEKIGGSEPLLRKHLAATKEHSMKETVTTHAARAPAPVASADHPDLALELRNFVAEHPDGWSHADWDELLERLRQRGHEVHDTTEIGRMLERQRLMMLLAQVRGVGLKRMESIAQRYPDVWSLRRASIDAVAESVRIPRSLAERILEAV